MIGREKARLTDIGVELGLVQVLDNLLDGRESPVPRIRQISAPDRW